MYINNLIGTLAISVRRCAFTLGALLPVLGVGVASGQGHPLLSSDSMLTMTELTGARRPRIAGLDDYRCFDTSYGWIFTKDSTALGALLSGLQLASRDFTHYFQTPIKHGALVLLDGLTPPGGDILRFTQAVKAAGAQWVLPWPNYAAPVVSDALKQQLMGAVGNAQTAENIAQDIIAKAPETMRHELGHLWLLAEFWPTSVMQPAKYYGGPGADWLDETAAVLLEGPILSRERRTTFWQAYRARRDPARIRPLATFFIMTHPDFVPNRSSQAGVTVTSGGGRGSVEFYGECRVFADFLWARAQDSTIFRSIAQTEARGAHMATWLRQHGSQYHLPATVEALETEWQQWLKNEADKEDDQP